MSIILEHTDIFGVNHYFKIGGLAHFPLHLPSSWNLRDEWEKTVSMCSYQSQWSSERQMTVSACGETQLWLPLVLCHNFNLNDAK